MPDFLTLFTYEINAKIVSFISQRDCLESMRVCRKWFELVPCYAANLWLDIDLRSSMLKKNDCLLKCLSNVQKVNLADSQLYGVIQEFDKHDISIHSLRILFMYYSETRFDNTKFFKLLNTSTCLKQLSNIKLISNFPSNISLVDFADACPQLTHLTIYLHDYLVRPIPVSDMLVKESPPKQFDQLVYLHLDARFPFYSKIEPFLRLCPKLQVFMASGRSGFDWYRHYDEEENAILEESVLPPFSERFYMDFAHLLEICSDLQTINWDDTSELNRMNDDILASNLTKNSAATKSAGLQKFRIAYDRPNRAESVIAFLENCKNTLTLLKIHQQEPNLRINHYSETVTERSDYRLDPETTAEDWYGLVNIKLSQIRELDISMRTDNFAIYVAQFLNVNRHQYFERISLTFRSQRLLTKQLISILSKISIGQLSIKVESVDLNTIPTYVDGNDDFDTIYGLLPINFDDLAGHPGLKDISLYNIPISDQVLLALGNNRGVQRISLSSPDYHSSIATLSSEGIYNYALTNNNDSLECLDLTSVKGLDDDALVALSRTRSLQGLDITHCTNVSDEGLKKFIDRVDPTIFKRLDVSFYGCPLITKKGILYIQSKTTENKIMYFS